MKEKIKRILELYEQGLSLGEIAEELNVSQSYVARKINQIANKIKLRVEKKEREVIVGEQTTIFKTTPTGDPLQEVNVILLEQLQRLRNLDLEETENSKLEIARSNAIASTSKTILQTIGIQMLVQKQQNNLLKIK